MGWQEARVRYQSGEAQAKQTTEDLVARRVLRGLGLPVAQMVRAERTLFGEANLDSALWVRTLAVLRYSLQQGRRTVVGLAEATFEVLEGDRQHKIVTDRFTELVGQQSDAHRTVMFTRIKGTQNSMAYMLLTPETLKLFTPPFVVLADISNWWLVGQSTEPFIAQFAPQDMFKTEDQ